MKEAGNDEYYAVYRGRFDTLSGRKSSYYNSKFLIRYINLFCINGGFQLLEERLNSGTDAFSAEFVGSFMTIIAGISPYLLNSAVDKYGPQILERIEKFMMNSPPEIVKSFSSDMIKNVIAGYTALCKRLHNLTDAQALYEKLFLQIAVNCVKTDYLERKLNGVTFLSDIHKSVKNKELGYIDKKILVKALEEGNSRLTQTTSSSRLSRDILPSSLNLPNCSN
jgi:ribosomal protein S17E